MRDTYCVMFEGKCEDVCCNYCPDSFDLDEAQETRSNAISPEHYARYEIEPIHFITRNDLDWFQGNIIKYVCRHDAKGGVEDLKKAQRYLEMYIAFLNGDPDYWK